MPKLVQDVLEFLALKLLLGSRTIMKKYLSNNSLLAAIAMTEFLVVGVLDTS